MVKAFGCTPSQAAKEPRGLAMRVLETISFVDGWSTISKLQKPEGPIGELAAKLYIEMVVMPKQGKAVVA